MAPYVDARAQGTSTIYAIESTGMRPGGEKGYSIVATVAIEGGILTVTLLQEPGGPFPMTTAEMLNRTTSLASGIADRVLRWFGILWRALTFSWPTNASPPPERRYPPGGRRNVRCLRVRFLSRIRCGASGATPSNRAGTRRRRMLLHHPSGRQRAERRGYADKPRNPQGLVHYPED